MNNQTRIVESLRKYGADIEPVGRIVISIGALCYALGLVVLNMYTSEYGFTSLSLFRIQYIICGLWSLLFLVASYILWLLLLFSVVSIFKKGARSAARLLAILCLVVVGIFANSFLQEETAPFGIEGTWRWIGGSFLAFVTVLMTQSTVDDFLKNKAPVSDLGIAISIGPIGAAFVFLLYLAFFASKLYPAVPPVLGGGKPQYIQLAISAADSKPIVQFGIPTFVLPGDSVRTTPHEWVFTENILLVSETEDQLVVIPRKSSASAITIPRAIVAAVKHYPDSALLRNRVPAQP